MTRRPYEGTIAVSTNNDYYYQNPYASATWTAFHFYLTNFDGYYSNAYFDPNQPPTSNQQGMTYTISADKKQIDLFFSSDPVEQSGSFNVYVNNTDNQQPFLMTYWPSQFSGEGINGVVPEPISSILFVTGGAVLAGRRYLRRKKKS